MSPMGSKLAVSHDLRAKYEVGSDVPRLPYLAVTPGIGRCDLPEVEVQAVGNTEGTPEYLIRFGTAARSVPKV